jgi:hypothetical protein
LTERARLLRTGLPAGAVSTTVTRPLPEGWRLMATQPGQVHAPDSLPPLEWRAATVPGTVADAIGPSHLDRHEDYDASDWWYRCSVPDPRSDDSRPVRRHDNIASDKFHLGRHRQVLQGVGIAFGAVCVLYSQRRSETFELALPVPDQRCRNDQQTC